MLAESIIVATPTPQASALLRDVDQPIRSNLSAGSSTLRSLWSLSAIRQQASDIRSMVSGFSSLVPHICASWARSGTPHFSLIRAPESHVLLTQLCRRRDGSASHSSLRTTTHRDSPHRTHFHPGNFAAAIFLQHLDLSSRYSAVQYRPRRANEPPSSNYTGYIPTSM